jgi:hypothetical protein
MAGLFEDNKLSSANQFGTPFKKLTDKDKVLQKSLLKFSVNTGHKLLKKYTVLRPEKVCNDIK